MAMQTIYCLAQDSRADEYAPRVKFTLTPTEYETYVDIAWKLEYIAGSAADVEDPRQYTIYIGDSTLTKTFGIDGLVGTHTVRSGTKKIEKTNSTQTINFGVSFEINVKWTNWPNGPTVEIGTISDENTITIPAVKQKVYYTITYADSNGEVYLSFTREKGYEGIVSNTSPTKTGYMFKGWTTVAGSNKVLYNPGDSLVVTKDITFYAIWEKLETYFIYYNTNGGTPTPDIQIKTQGEPIELTNDVPTREGYVFKGWSTTYSGSVEYGSGSIYSEDKEVVLYAIWEELHYDITYNANGGFFNDGSTSIVKKKYKSFNAHIINLKPTRENYEFKGWSTTLNGEVKYVENDVYSANQNLTLYAVWEKISNIKIVELYRCDIDGNKISDGTYARLQFEYTATNLLLPNSSTLEWKRTSESNYTDSVVMTHAPCDKGKTITIDTIFGNGNLSNEESYAVLITMNESGVTYTKELALAVKTVFVDFKPPTDTGTGGMAIGKSAQFDGVLDIGYQTRFSGGIKPSFLNFKDDLNNVTTPNIYSLIAGLQYVNCPITTDGTLFVEPYGQNGNVRQVVVDNKDYSTRYERYYNKSTGTWNCPDSNWKINGATINNSTAPQALIIPVLSGFMVIQWGRVSATITNDTVTNTSVVFPYQYPDNASYQVFAHAYNTIPNKISTSCYGLAANGFKVYLHATGASSTSAYVGWQAIGFSPTYPTAATATTSLE